jgi:hypothetical protein
MVELPNYDIAIFRNGRSLVTAGRAESLGKLTLGMIVMPESLVKFVGGCSPSWLHFHYLLTGMVGLPNYNVALFRNGCNQVNVSSPELPRKLTVGMIVMLESPVKFPSECGAS